MKVAIYSAVFGNYDPDPYDVTKLQRPDVDFWWFTDKNMHDIGGWKIKIDINPTLSTQMDFAKANRFYKLQPHKIDIINDSDINVYIDGNKRLFNIDLLLYYCQELYDNPDLDAIFCKHTERDTVAQEVREVCRLRRDDPKLVTSQYKEYQAEGFPDNIPLPVASVQIRKTHAPNLQKMLDCWWNEVYTKSYRDQISSTYSFWKTGFTRYRLINVWTERLKMIANENHRKSLVV